MLPHMFRQLIILFLFKRSIVKFLSFQLIRIRAEQKINECLIVKYSMNVSAHTFLVVPVAVFSSINQLVQWRRRSTLDRYSPAHVYLVSFTDCSCSVKSKIHLSGHFISLHGGNHRKQSQSGKHSDISFHPSGSRTSSPII